MKRNAPSIASFFDFNSKTAYPPTTSLASVKGPSIAATCPRESRTRVLTAVGASPPLATIVPALTASSLSFAIASMSSLGGGPEFSACFTSIMNRIVISPFSFRLGAKFLDGVCRLNPGSTYASNERQQDWQVPQFFWTDLPMPRWVPAAVIADGHAILNPPVQAGVRRNYFFAALLSCSDWARRRSSCSLSSGVNSGPKSAASNTRRISTSVSSLWGLGQRFSHSMASSIDLTCHSQKPAINSFVSVNGPSITVRFAPENRTRTPFELAWSPSPASMMPAFTSSSLYFPISARSFWPGRTPASESLLALTITMTRIGTSPFGLVFETRASRRPRPAGPSLYLHVERAAAISTGPNILFSEACIQFRQSFAFIRECILHQLGSENDEKQRPA